MKSTAASWFLLASMFTGTGHATLWGDPELVPDPVRPGAKCAVSQPMSYGSYIYDWPSKYDQVFWPLTTPQGIWFCPESGFTAFIGDFELSANERAALATELGASYQKIKSPSLREKLLLLEKSYVARNVNAGKKIQLLRVLAYYHETEFKDFDAANNFRRKALELIETALTTKLPEDDRLEYLFVSAAYYREFGDVEESKARIRLLNQALQQSSDEKLAGFVKYLTELKKDIDRIAPGGAYIPD
jgi:hypothetical protein